jgi:hypothetical protein
VLCNVATDFYYLRPADFPPLLVSGFSGPGPAQLHQVQAARKKTTTTITHAVRTTQVVLPPLCVFFCFLGRQEADDTRGTDGRTDDTGFSTPGTWGGT